MTTDDVPSELSNHFASWTLCRGVVICNLSIASIAMFTSERKRRRLTPAIASEETGHCEEVEGTITVGRDELSTTNDPEMRHPTNTTLRGVVACLSGFTLEEKSRFHEIVVGLGGSYTRELNLSVNTHLIARESQGPKYDAAKDSVNVRVVTKRWLEDCVRLNCRVDEKDYGFDVSSRKENVDVRRVEAKGVHDPRHPLALLERIEVALREDVSGGLRPLLFSAGKFCLVGFGNDNKHLRNQLGKLLRRGLGTIYWDYHDEITHVIVNDGADDSKRDAVGAITSEQPERPSRVSPTWVLRSWTEGKLVPEIEFPPVCRDGPGNQNVHERNPAVASKRKSVFEGYLFCILRVTPPEWAVDFDSKQIEREIVANGGKILSPKIVDALKVDNAAADMLSTAVERISASNDATIAKRKCYVVAWGGATHSHVDIHPQLSQVKRQSLCHLVHVTPIWLSTCISEQRVLQPGRHPSLFEPGKRPIHWLLHPTTSNAHGVEALTGHAAAAKATSAESNVGTVRISVTGFSGSIRTALMHCIKAIGATYEDSMRASTTHLICREASGAKYDKAVEWKIHVVSLEWLFHVMQYGFEGSKGLKGGCESEFAVISTGRQ